MYIYIQNIKLNGSGKQGRYVRIQLLDKIYLSLAEVQVIGTDLQVILVMFFIINKIYHNI
jgi:hypothetical protein